MPKQNFEVVSAGELRLQWKEILNGVQVQDTVYILTMNDVPIAQLGPLTDDAKAALKKSA